MIRIEQNEIVKVAANHPRGLDGREDFDVSALRRARKMPREQAELDCSRGIQLAVEARFHFAFMLKLGREPAATRLGSAQVLRQHDAEYERR